MKFWKLFLLNLNVITPPLCIFSILILCDIIFLIDSKTLEFKITSCTIIPQIALLITLYENAKSKKKRLIEESKKHI